MAGNLANHGYLCGIILKELAAGRVCEVTGGAVATIETYNDYKSREDRLIGRFGEVVHRGKDGMVALIATRDAPDWARRKIHETIWGCEEMTRWFIPEEKR